MGLISLFSYQPLSVLRHFHTRTHTHTHTRTHTHTHTRTYPLPLSTHQSYRTLGVPYTQHALEDVLLMRCAVQTGLSAKSGIVIYRMVTQNLNMDLRSLKKWLHRFAAIDFDKDGFINVVDLARFLHLPSDACVQAAFTAADKVIVTACVTSSVHALWSTVILSLNFSSVQW